MSKYFDVCIIGSGAGAGPIAYEMAMTGKSVVVIEKGGWYNEQDFSKDEIGTCRRDHYVPKLEDEPHVIEDFIKGKWKAESNAISGGSFWNGNIVGGSSNFMSGYFHRMKPVDFKLLSEFGAIEGANVVDWPVSYEEMEPYFAKVEEIVGISGKVVNHPSQEPRSTKDFPFPSMIDHPFANWIDESSKRLGYHPFPMPRAILTKAHNQRNACYYSVFCGSYGCNSGAKGSSRAALLDVAFRTGNCEIRPHSMAYKLVSDSSGKVTELEYFDKEGIVQKVNAKAFVVACQAIESSRLLLMSVGPKHKNGLGNNSGQVGKNLIFSAGGIGRGDFYFKDFTESQVKELQTRGPFVNRALQDWYVIDDPKLGRIKGGTVDFLHEHPNPIRKANKLKYGDQGKLVWGQELKDKLEFRFNEMKQLQFEVFNDWLPTDDCFVSLDPKVKDKWGLPVAKVRIGNHEHDIKVGKYLAEKSELLLKEMGARNITSSISGSPPPNLMAGGCRFGDNPKFSVLNKNCQLHDAENVFVTDGSFMPTGGSVTYTWTIYANSFRVADIIKSSL